MSADPRKLSFCRRAGKRNRTCLYRPFKWALPCTAFQQHCHGAEPMAFGYGHHEEHQAPLALHTVLIIQLYDTIVRWSWMMAPFSRMHDFVPNFVSEGRAYIFGIHQIRSRAHLCNIHEHAWNWQQSQRLSISTAAFKQTLPEGFTLLLLAADLPTGWPCDWFPGQVFPPDKRYVPILVQGACRESAEVCARGILCHHAGRWVIKPSNVWEGFQRFELDCFRRQLCGHLSYRICISQGKSAEIASSGHPGQCMHRAHPSFLIITACQFPVHFRLYLCIWMFV